MGEKVPAADDDDSRVSVRSYFVPTRGALVARADFGPLYMDWFLHSMAHQLGVESQLGEVLKDALAAMTLHLASRPRDEVTAWTVNFQEPLFNLFVTGDTRRQRVVGRIFTEDIRKQNHSVLISQVTDRRNPPQQSMVAFEGNAFFPIVESYFNRSEQRRTRLFRHGAEDIVMVSTQPDGDARWLARLTDDRIRSLDRDEPLSLLEERFYRFACGCDIERFRNTFREFSDDAVDALFGEDEVVAVRCPRCAAHYWIERSSLKSSAE